MVANYAHGKRRFDCYATEADALDAANRLARQLSEREVVAAAMTNEQAGRPRRRRPEPSRRSNFPCRPSLPRLPNA